MELLFIDDLQGANYDAIVTVDEGATLEEVNLGGGESSENAGPATTEEQPVPANSGGEATEGQQPAGSPWAFWIMIVAMIAIMYFFMWRPERKRRKQMEEFRNNLKKGDKIVTAGGIYGTIKEVHEKSLLVEIEGNVTLRIDKGMVVSDPSNGLAR